MSNPAIPRILVLADRVGATQHISFTAPLRQLAAEGAMHLIVEAGSKSKNVLIEKYTDSNPSVFVLSRYSSMKIDSIVASARKKNIPVIYHIDDDLLAVPPSLGVEKHRMYNDPKHIEGLRSLMGMSDLVYASTSPLAEAFRAHGITTPIVAGDIYCSVDPDTIAPPSPSMSPVIGYMGTEGHAADLALIVPAIARVMEDIPDLRFEIFGSLAPPETLMRFGHRIGRQPPVANYEGFVGRLRSLGWWIGLAPLEDNGFNRCKADTKWVEYSLAGMAVVASDLPVYHKACAGGAGVLAGEPETWYGALRMLIRDGERRRGMIAAAQAKLAIDYSRDRLQRQVVNVFAAARASMIEARKRRTTF